MTRGITNVGIFAALYIVSSVTLALLAGPLIRGYPSHFFRGLFISCASASSRMRWSGTLFGTVSGVIFLLTIPAPAPYLLVASPVAGLIYDLVIASFGNYAQSARRTKSIMLANGASGTAEGFVAMAVLIFSGVISGTATLLMILVATAVSVNLVLSCAGGYGASLVIKRGLI
ncbi:MAG: hypothetical protein NZ920_02550 [Aigarchaeota archaeon]|nr:hypothetical protein [Aigarchaeota archaeon]MDW8092495.1 hypothetical protein [Nitrososphaerota archaeon]